jgi:ribonuclease-3 family protein
MEKGLASSFQNIFRSTNSHLGLEDIAMMSPLQLAYIGDAVYELFVRTAIMERDLNAKLLHKKAKEFVRAGAQADLVHILDSMLDEKEKDMVRKGRNAKTNSSPKGAELIDYKYATGFECLLGYLYLSGNDERLLELFKMIIEIKG